MRESCTDNASFVQREMRRNEQKATLAYAERPIYPSEKQNSRSRTRYPASSACMQRTVKKTLQVPGGIGIGGAKLKRGGDDVGAGGFLRRSDGRVADLAGAASAGAFRDASRGYLILVCHRDSGTCAESKDSKTQLIGNFTRNRKRYSNRRDKEERERAKERNQRGGERHRDRLRKPKRRIGRLSRWLASFPTAPPKGTAAAGTSSAAAAPPWLRWPCLLEVVDESAQFFQRRAEVRVSSGGFGTVSAPKSFASDPDQLKSAREDIKELLSGDHVVAGPTPSQASGDQIRNPRLTGRSCGGYACQICEPTTRSVEQASSAHPPAATQPLTAAAPASQSTPPSIAPLSASGLPLAIATPSAATSPSPESLSSTVEKQLTSPSVCMWYLCMHAEATCKRILHVEMDS
ncbi:hypothetical protein Fmac_002133 [Flemingia macrophylla]|uniref:Uncharacterized protein n=1 Tax=Flemingia macrophylla TaxID=520843 RepID=A0ABD1NJ19_9FABA